MENGNERKKKVLTTVLTCEIWETQTVCSTNQDNRVGDGTVSL